MSGERWCPLDPDCARCAEIAAYRDAHPDIPRRDMLLVINARSHGHHVKQEAWK